MKAFISDPARSSRTALDDLGISDDSLRSRALPEFREARELVVAELDADGREHLLAPECASAWQRLKLAAAADGVDLRIASGFRSIQRQQEIIRMKMQAGQALASILTLLAPPGYSEHHTGCAVDIRTPGIKSLDPEFENSAAFQWLSRHAASYGFTMTYPRDNAQGFQYEPWHWCYQPQDAQGTPT